MRADPQPRAMRVVSAETQARGEEINGFLRHPSAAGLTVFKAQPYPPGLVLFDALAVGLGAIIARFWSAPVCLAAFRRLSGASAESGAAPLIGIMEHIGELALWLSRRRKP